MAHEAELQIESDLDRLPDGMEWFEQFKPELPNACWQQANMAFMEGFTNAVRHAHAPLKYSPPLFLKAALSSEVFWFEIWDQGNPYDFDAAIVQLQQMLNAPDFDPLVREKQWGQVIFLRLIQQYNWEIQYSRHGKGQNCFRAKIQLTSMTTGL